MIKRLSEFLSYLLIKHKIVEIDDRDICVYAMGTILLNLSLLIVFFLESFVFSSIKFGVVFMLFMVPLRIFAGGYHAKTSLGCFIFSIASLSALLFIYNTLDCNAYGIILLLIGCASTVPIIILAPIQGLNHPLTAFQLQRNRGIIMSLLALYFMISGVFIAFKINAVYIISYAVIFVSGNLLLEQLVRNFRGSGK